MADLTKEQVLNKALSDYRENLPKPDNDGIKKPIDWKEVSKLYLGKTSQTKVLCKDGTFGYDISSPNAKYDNSKTCINNGGRAEKQPIANNGEIMCIKSPCEDNTPSLPTKSKEPLTKKLLGAYNQNLIIAVVLVAGYFAYKKFKK